MPGGPVRPANSLGDFIDRSLNSPVSASWIRSLSVCGNVGLSALTTDPRDIIRGRQAYASPMKRTHHGRRTRRDHFSPDSRIVSIYGAVMRDLEDTGMTLRAARRIQHRRPTPSGNLLKVRSKKNDNRSNANK